MATTIDIEGGKDFDAAITALAEKLSGDATLQVGFFAEARYTARRGDVNLPVATVAATQEFGTVTNGGFIPSRPFFRNAIAKNSPDWSKDFVAIVKGQHYDVPKSLDAIGEMIVGQVQRSIDETNEPPLSPVTIRKKGFSKPLIETGDMKRSVTHKVNLT